MIDTTYTQFPQNSQPNSVNRRLQHSQRETPVRGVVQDKPLFPTAPTASRQPDPIDTHHRAETLNTNSNRTQYLFTGKYKAVKATTWLNPLVKQEMERNAKLYNVSLSKVIAIACEEWAHKSIFRQHEAMLFPMLRQMFREELRSFGDRIVHFLMYIAVAIEAIRILITNVLDRILVWTGKPDEYANLVQRSDILARQKVNDKIPYLKTLVQQWNTNPTDQDTKKGEAG